MTTADCLPGPGCRSARANIFSQLGGLNWRMFGESMPRPCYRANARLYVPRHAPALFYYTRVGPAACRADVVPLPARRIKLKRKFTWIVPNLQHRLGVADRQRGDADRVHRDLAFDAREGGRAAAEPLQQPAYVGVDAAPAVRRRSVLREGLSDPLPPVTGSVRGQTPVTWRRRPPRPRWGVGGASRAAPRACRSGRTS